MTGVKVPSIHHYRRAGLLPPPHEVAPNRFEYGEVHVEALLTIRLLRERQGLSLATIRDVLPGLLVTQHEEAFRTEMWDDVIAAHVRETEPTKPPARLLASAREAFSRHGFYRTNVGDITEEAGMAKGSFYRYFCSKEEIFLAAVRSLPDAVDESLRGQNRATGSTPFVRSARQLEVVFEPFLPLLLETATRELHGEPGHQDLTKEVVAAIAARAARHLRSPVGAGRSTQRAVESSIFHLLERTLGLGH